MPHSALRLMAGNAQTTDPSFLAEHAGSLADANTLSDVGRIIGFPEDLVGVAAEIDEFLPGAIVNALVGAYRAAAESGTDGLAVTWERSSGFSISVAQSPGTDAASDGGVISVTIKSPPLGQAGQAG